MKFNVKVNVKDANARIVKTVNIAVEAADGNRAMTAAQAQARTKYGPNAEAVDYREGATPKAWASKDAAPAAKVDGKAALKSGRASFASSRQALVEAERGLEEVPGQAGLDVVKQAIRALDQVLKLA